MTGEDPDYQLVVGPAGGFLEGLLEFYCIYRRQVCPKRHQVGKFT